MGVLMIRPTTILALALIAGACSREATLYPEGLTTGSTALKAKFTDSGMGKGPVEITMPDGEVLKGEFSTTDTSSYGFSSAFASAGRTTAVASGSSSAVPGSMPGIVNAIGPNGTSLRCDYLVNTFSGSGSGRCETNKGATYAMHF